MTTISAAVKLIPYPPALVDNKNTSLSFVGSLNLSMAFYLSLALIYPSIFSYLTALYFRYSSKIESIIVNYENINIFLPSLLNLFNNLSNKIILPELSISLTIYSLKSLQFLLISFYISWIRNGWLQHFLNYISKLFNWVAFAANCEKPYSNIDLFFS